MVFPTEIDSVDIHASVVGPIIRECDDQFDAGLACSIDDFIESLDVDCRLAVRPALEDDFSASSTFTAVLWKTFRDVCDVLVIESPCSQDVQASLFRGGHAQFDIGLIL
jgi:hypothetical protein